MGLILLSDYNRIVVKNRKIVYKWRKILSEISSLKLASAIARILDNKLAKDIVILNISNVSTIADYFVICSAESSTQVRALSENVKNSIKKTFKIMPIGEEKDLKSRWNLLDYGEVVVHVLHQEERQIYTLEKLWNQACTVDQEEWMQETEDQKDLLA